MPTRSHTDLGPVRDAELLRRFVAVRDEVAFEELIRRYGPLVMGVCRQSLSSPEDQDDAFQATFLTLASRAANIRKGQSLASWLHGVTVRVVKHMHRSNAQWRRGLDRARARSDQDGPPTAPGTQWKLELHEELDRLPTRYKDAILLCDGYGFSRKEAAGQLGIPVGTLATNLRRGRELLRSRLAKSGSALTAVAVTTALGAIAQGATPVSDELIRSTARKSLLFLAGQSAGKAVQASIAVHLARSIIRRMVMAKLLSTSVLCIAVAALAIAVPELAQTNLLRAQSKLQYVFGEAVAFPEPVNLPFTWNSTPNVSPDGLELFFTSNRNGWGTYVARRTGPSAPFRPPTKLTTELNHGVVSNDGLSLFANSDVLNGFGQSDVFVLTRPTPGDDFGPPQNLGTGVNSHLAERWTSLSADGLELYFTRTGDWRLDGARIWIATRDTSSALFGNATQLPSSVNQGNTGFPSISADGLTLFFTSNRSGGFGGYDIWAATRPSEDAPWGEPMNLGPQVNSRLDDITPSLALDGKTFYFARAGSLATGPSELSYAPVRVIPEPSTAALGAIGMTSLCAFIWIRRHPSW